MITRINNNRGRRFLNPLEIEAQYVTEDRATNPDLLLWIDFTDATSLRSSNSGGISVPTNGQGIQVAHNKSYEISGSTAGMASAGEKALGKYAAQVGSTSKCPVFVDPGDGTPSYATFDGNQFLEITKQVGAAVNGTDFSTTELDLNSFCMYFVCERENPSTLTRQDVMFLTSNDFSSDTPRQHVAFSFDPDASYRATVEMRDSNQATGETLRYVRYDDGDDTNFHYHAFNAYENYNNNSPDNKHVSLQADGTHHQFGEHSANPSLFPSPFYSRIGVPGGTVSGPSGLGKQGGQDITLQFTSASLHHPSITIGGQSRFGSASSLHSKGTFKGKIYEVLIFKNEHAGPAIVDVLFLNKLFKRRWSNMYYYLQRKYQHITVKI